MPKSDDDGSFEDAFRSPVVFDRPSLALRFDASVLDVHRCGCARNVAGVTIEDVAQARMEPASRQNLLGAATAQIRCQVLSGRVSIDHAAHSLGVSIRSLQRELNSAGKSFRELANAIKLIRATELLREDALTVDEISRQLGYSSSAHFARAFRRETGRSPREFREVHYQFLGIWPDGSHSPIGHQIQRSSV